MTERRDPPRLAVKSVDEMLAIAQAMEREAAGRYAMLADCMRRVDQREIAQLLDGLAAEERAHCANVERLAARMLHRAPDPNLVPATLPKTFAREDEANAAALLSPYRTLSIAVRHEERAFAFWTYVAAEVDSPVLREMAEMSAKQELIHAAELRRARRRAFHAERSRQRTATRDADPAAAPKFRVQAAPLEWAFAAFCGAAEQQLRSGGDLVTADLFQSLGDEARRAAASLNPTSSGAAAAPDLETAVRRSRMHAANGAGLLFEAAGMIEDLDYRYLEWLDAAAEQKDVEELEARARSATARLVRIDERLRALEPAVAAIFETGAQE